MNLQVMNLQGKSIIAVVLGASGWPKYPGLPESRAFSNSAEGFRRYLKNEAIFGLPDSNILWLFDSDDAPSVMDTKIRDFLGERISVKESPITDLIIYYTGHGRIAIPDKKFQVILRSTEHEAVPISAYKIADLASSLNRYARNLRKWIFLDCCSSAAAYPDFQPQDSGEVATILREEMEKALPRSGTALLCASSADQVALNPEGAEYTMFSGALLAVLNSGNDGLEKLVTLREIGKLVEDNIFNIYREKGVRPDISSPDQRKGDLADNPFFPNVAKFTPQAKKLPETLRILLEDANPLIREGAIRTLGAWLLSSDKNEMETAQAKLNELRQVKEYAESHGAIDHVFHLSESFSKLKDSRQLMNHNLKAANLIYYNLYSPESNPKRKYRRIVQTYTVEDNGDAHVSREVNIIALDKPIHMLQLTLESSERTELTSLKLDIISTDENKDCDVTYLFSRDEPDKKEVILFFLPFIESTEEEGRNFKIKYVWEKYWLPLIKNGRDSTAYTVSADRDVDELIYKVFVRENLNVYPEMVKPVLRGNHLRRYDPTNDAGYILYEFEIRNAPAKSMVYEIALMTREL